jgi:hypothetical protein
MRPRATNHKLLLLSQASHVTDIVICAVVTVAQAVITRTWLLRAGVDIVLLLLGQVRLGVVERHVGREKNEGMGEKNSSV